MIERMDLFEQPWPEGDFRFFQLGHVVDNVLAAAAGWARTFGVGPFHVLPVVEQQADYGGEIRTVRIQVAVAQAGPVQIELIQQHLQYAEHLLRVEPVRNEYSRPSTVTLSPDDQSESGARRYFSVIVRPPSADVWFSVVDLLRHP